MLASQCWDKPLLKAIGSKLLAELSVGALVLDYTAALGEQDEEGAGEQEASEQEPSERGQDEQGQDEQGQDEQGQGRSIGQRFELQATVSAAVSWDSAHAFYVWRVSGGEHPPSAGAATPEAVTPGAATRGGGLPDSEQTDEQLPSAGAHTSRVAVGNRVEAMETYSSETNGVDSWRVDPLAASRLSNSSAQSTHRPPTLVRADSVSRESCIVSADAFIERLEGRHRVNSMASPKHSSVAELERQLWSAREATLAEAARADKAEKLVVALESKVVAAQVEAEALRAQLAKLTLGSGGSRL